MYRENLIKLLNDYNITSVSTRCETYENTQISRLEPGDPLRFFSEKKLGFNEWKRGGKPNDPIHPLLIDKHEKDKHYSEMAAKHNEKRQEILNAKSENSQLFHKLKGKQRGNLASCVDKLYVCGEVYKENDVLSGWFKHSTLCCLCQTIIKLILLNF